MFLSQTVALSDFSSTAEARRAGARMAASLGMSETKSGETAIVITEAARNAVVYGGGGQLVVSGTKSKHETRMEILALDRERAGHLLGPDVERPALRQPLLQVRRHGQPRVRGEGGREGQPAAVE